MAEITAELHADPVRFIEGATSPLHRLLATESEDTLPGVLHHYTSGQGLLGILGSGQMYCTNVLYMNDSSEMDYGRELVAQILHDQRQYWPEAVRRCLDRIPLMLEQPDFQYFVSCFCEKSDLLSQWRAYGAQAAGYSVGFSTDDLVTVLPEYAELVRVIMTGRLKSDLSATCCGSAWRSH